MATTRIRPTRRALHVVGDVVLIGWALAWGVVAWMLKGVVDALAVPAQGIVDTTDALATRVDETAGQLRDVALVGDQLATPFGPIASTLRTLSEQSMAQVETVHQVGWAMFFVVFLIPTLTVALLYLPPRIRRARESAAARSFVDQQADLDLFALRAMANLPMTKLAAISDDPVTAWRAGDPDVIRALADLEMRRVGIGMIEPEQFSHRATRV